MTKQYDDLQDVPQIDIHKSDLTLDERQQLRTISTTGSKGRSKNVLRRFTTVYYLEGDEENAAERFVEENRDSLEQLDLDKPRNALQSDVNGEIYDWILHFLGERHLRKFDSVVIEERSDGTIWAIERDHFDKGTARRYSISDQVATRIQGETLQSIYQQFEETITESDLREIAAIEGDVRYVLDTYRSAPEFDCKPISADGELAIQKQDSDSGDSS